MPNSLPKIHLWVPGIQPSLGGIQRFSHAYVSAVARIFPNHTIIVFVKNDFLVASAAPLGTNVQIISFANVPNFVRTLCMSVLAGLAGVLHKPRVIISTHIHFLPAIQFVTKIIDSPFGSVMHGIDVWHLSRPYRIAALLNADFLMSVSLFTARRAAKDFLLDEKSIQIIPATYDEEHFTINEAPQSLRNKYGLKSDDRIILTVGRLSSTEAYKGHDRVIRALPGILRKIPNCYYLIAGDGDGKAALEQLSWECGVENNVIFAGYVDSTELPSLYRICDVFAMPSTGEGFGIVFLEALACGKPVIAGNQDASAEALAGGELGVLVDPFDVDAIANAIVNVLSGSVLPSRLVDPKFLSTRVVELFGFNNFVKRVEAALKPFLSLNEEAPFVKPSVTNIQHSTAKKTATIVTQLTSPYQIELFNEIAGRNKIQLRVIYLSDQDKMRHWETRPLLHEHIIISRTPWLKESALRWIDSSDLAIFTFYTDAFALNCIRRRAGSKKAWCFWGERPGVKQLGIFGLLFRRAVLRSLHQSRVPIWGIGEYALEGYKKEFGRHRNYFNLPYYSDLRRFESTSFHEHRSDFTFLFSGRLVQRKGVDLILQAFQHMITRRNDVRLVIMGTGFRSNLVNEMINQHPNHVRWLGFVDWPNLPQAYAEADCLLAPSRYDGWGMVVPEAMASGLPVISTNRMGAALEMIRHKENGWLIKAGDLSDLTNAMEEAVNMPKEQFLLMKKRARETVADHSLYQGASRFEDLVEKSLSIMAD